MALGTNTYFFIITEEKLLVSYDSLADLYNYAELILHSPFHSNSMLFLLSKGNVFDDSTTATDLVYIHVLNHEIFVLYSMY